MSEFKHMKFWIGDDPELSERVQKLLFSLGCFWGDHSRKVINKRGSILYVYETGRIDWDKEDREYFSSHTGEEINIDWMRSNKPETVELGGKTYIKAELEEALSKIKPV